MGVIGTKVQRNIPNQLEDDLNSCIPPERSKGTHLEDQVVTLFVSLIFAKLE